MVLTKNHNSISSKLEKIKENIRLENELLTVDVNEIKEKAEKKIDRFIKKQNDELYLKEITFQDIDAEVNKRIANAMLKYNIKDYWMRREVIQTWRVSNCSEEATLILKEKLAELNKQKVLMEEETKEKIKTRLSTIIASTEEARKANEENYKVAVEKAKADLNEYKKKINSKKTELIAKRINKTETKVNRLKALEEKLNSQLSENSSDSIVLPKNIVLKVENLTMQFGGLKAVDNLSFEVKKGEVFGLIGPNGAGKTTVFNCITQFYKPTDGKLYFQEKYGNTILLTDYVVHDIIKKGIIRTFQNVEVIKEISVLDNLLVAAHTQYKSGLVTQFLHLPKLKKEEKVIRQKALEVLEFMGLSMYADWLAWGLPYGILKKIEIARTLMNNPQLIILDEPAAGLNDTETVELSKLIKKIQEKYNCTILLVEHDMGLVMDICDTICAISFGKLLAIGNAKEIQENKDVQAAYLGYVEEE